MSNIYGKLALILLGVGLTLGIEALLSSKKPNFVYRHRHFGNPQENGQVIVDVKGAKLGRTPSKSGGYIGGYGFAGGAEEGKTVVDMINEAFDDFNGNDSLLKQAGVDGKVGEVTISVRKYAHKAFYEKIGDFFAKLFYSFK